MGKRTLTIAKKTLLVLCLVLVSSRTGAAAEYAWRFSAGSDAMSWKTLNASPERSAAGFTLVRQDDPFWFVSPDNLNIGPEVSYIEFRLKAPETYLNGYIIVRTRDNRSWEEEFSLGLPDAFHVYRIHLQRGNGTGSPIDTIAFAFGAIDRVSFDYVRIYQPSFVQLLGIYWSELWDVRFAGATTVNFVSTPRIAGYSFLAPLYGLLLLVALGVLALRRPLNTDSVTKTLLLACAVAGTLFALRMDYAWFMQWRADRASLGRGSLEERISRVDGTGAYDFARGVKQVIPAGGSVRVFAGVLAGKVKYYLLPVKVSRDAPYIAVFKDPAISFDPAQKTLKRDNVVVATDAQLLTAIGNEGSLYRSSAGGRR
jgi:hypothetical protein